ncbi:uncharacterized protein KNAG_0L02330 [Huiozyma naganishii CBS 8797]|uniref:MARVEL domain-containing protein n=1 Tax=Huiozyma naganishii (strain ATCC MYA-139 / BCRC 22969 / CBS 8797 / KCTC 17520 / NBRC 10181 / NCYC 3082 / Yp74L-3) TaxID=1071383 RepID=J7SAL5_HUIN7|nr:hypothetical protein KNAG_0L02330 [Kazachstania naganishii CBS 8797]CCK72849.1 hypothetical protein KNAG_0L02330 [Kazachstania naganishii CBS 8797]
MDTQAPPQVYDKQQRTSSTTPTRFNTGGNAASHVGFFILRFLQFCSAVLVMSLLAYSLNSYNFFGSKRANFCLSVGVIGTFYIMCVIVLVWLMPKVVLVGPYLIMEIVICLLWLCGFIVSAKVFGSHSCSSNGFSYDPFVGRITDHSHKRACQAAKSSIAFSGFSFVLGVITSILLGVYVLKPITEAYGNGGLWKTGSSMGTRLHRSSGLELNNPPNGESGYAGDSYGTTGTAVAPAQDDLEANNRVYNRDQRTVSTNSTNNDGSYHHEKVVHASGRVSGDTAVSNGVPAATTTANTATNNEFGY